QASISTSPVAASCTTHGKSPRSPYFSSSRLTISLLQRPTHGKAAPRAFFVDLRDRERAEMEDGGGERRRCAGRERIGKVRRRPRAAARDDRHRDYRGDRAGQIHVESAPGAISIDGREQDLSRPAVDRLA